MIRRAADIAKFLVPLIIAFFIARVIYRNWQEVEQADWVVDPRFLFLSFALTTFWYLLRPWTWKLLLAGFGYHIPYPVAYRIVRRAELSRYVPGGVWQYVSRVYLAGKWGVPATACIVATFVETALLLLASILPALWSLDQALPFLKAVHRVLLWVVPLVVLGAIHPRVLNAWAGFLARRFKQPYTELKIHWLTLAGVWLLYSLIWLTYASSAALFVRGIIRVPIDSLPLLGSDYILAWLVGMVSVIAPAGMGIRDGVFGLLLEGILPLGASLTVAVALRLWTTVEELIWALGVERIVRRWEPAAGPAVADESH